MYNNCNNINDDDDDYNIDTYLPEHDEDETFYPTIMKMIDSDDVLTNVLSIVCTK